MGLFTREYRSEEDWTESVSWNSFYPEVAKSSSGVVVTPETAKKFTVAFACISLRARTLASLRCKVVKIREDGRTEDVRSHYLNGFVDGMMNRDTNEFNWFETGVMHHDLWGNYYNIVTRDSRNEVKDIWQVRDPSDVKVYRAERRTPLDDGYTADVGDIIYEIRGDRGEKKKFSSRSILHIPNIGQDGIVGSSQIQLARDAYGSGLALQEFNGKFFKQGVTTSGIITIDGDLGENRKNFQESVNSQMGGLGNVHKVMVLEEGATYKPITMPLKDAQFIEAMDLSGRVICGFYGVPPYMVGVPTSAQSYNSLEQENAGFRTRCIFPTGERFVKAMSNKLFTQEEIAAGFRFAFDYDDYLKADLAARATYWRKMLEIGVAPNTIMAKEGLPSIGEYGDESFIPANLQRLKDREKNEA